MKKFLLLPVLVIIFFNFSFGMALAEPKMEVVGLKLDLWTSLSKAKQEAFKYALAEKYRLETKCERVAVKSKEVPKKGNIWFVVECEDAPVIKPFKPPARPLPVIDQQQIFTASDDRKKGTERGMLVGFCSFNQWFQQDEKTRWQILNWFNTAYLKFNPSCALADISQIIEGDRMEFYAVCLMAKLPPAEPEEEPASVKPKLSL